MIRLLFCLPLLVALLGSAADAQPYMMLRISTYNVLNLGDNDYNRAVAFRQVLRAFAPDVLICQEVTDESGVQMLLDSALNSVAVQPFRMVPFHNGPDSDNALLYNAGTVELIDARYHPTALRDIAEYVLLPRMTGSTDTLVIFSMHLKAGDDDASELQRVEEAKIVRALLEGVPETRHFIVAGDLNVYTATEGAYQWLTNSSFGTASIAAIDPIDRPGEWNSNPDFADIHTQSTRMRQFGGGITGGLDDRFDFLLLSPSLMTHYLDESYTAFGNDGEHFNDSINAMPNSAVPQDVAQALHDASDHLPVFLDLAFPLVVTSVWSISEGKKKEMEIW